MLYKIVLLLLKSERLTKFDGLFRKKWILINIRLLEVV